MKTIKISLVFVLSLCLYSCTKDITDPGGHPGPSYNVNGTLLLQLVNNVRQSGCVCGSTNMSPVSPVSWNDQLAKAAYDHSSDMKTNNYFSHVGQNGSSAADRIRNAGYNWKTYGENIAQGFTTEEAVVNGWLGSEGHCRNIMNPSFTEMGVGREGNYWTQVFGAK